MSMIIDNSIINARSFLMESHPVDAKKVKFGDASGETAAMAVQQIAEDIMNGLDESKILDLTSVISKTIPELKQPKMDETTTLQNAALQPIANKLEQLLEAFDSSSEKENAQMASAKQDSGYLNVKENWAAALYGDLLQIFSSLNKASANLTATHATLAEKLAISSGNKLVEAAKAEMNKSIAMGTTSMVVSGVGTGVSHKGLSKQQRSLKFDGKAKDMSSASGSVQDTFKKGTNVAAPKPSAEITSDEYLTKKGTISGHSIYEDTRLKFSGEKKELTGKTVAGMGNNAGTLVSSGFGVTGATESAGAQIDTAAKDSTLESEVKNRESQNAARASLKALLDAIYQAMEKNNDAISHTAQMLKV